MRSGLHALLLASAALALAAGSARAQETDAARQARSGALGLRPGTAPARPTASSALGASSLGPTATDPALQLPSAAAKRRAQPTKRTRQPAAALVRPPRVRETVVPLRLREADRVQPPVLGLPDPPPPPSTLAGPAELRRRRLAAADDPYAPLGIKEGGVVYYPAIGQSVGYDTNPSRVSPGAKGSVLLRTDGELKFRSDWSAHELSGELRGGYSLYPQVSGADRPDGDGVVRLRLDANRDTAIDVEGRYRIDTQRPGSPDLNVATSERPIVATFGGSAGVTQRFNRFSLGLRGNVDREVYENARLASGSVLRQDDRDATQYGLRLRAAYELTPGLTPFVDALIDTRVHDLPIDYSGFRRDSDGVGVKAGSSFEISRILTGEVSAGIQRRRYVDRRLRDLEGPLVDASLVWAATPLTTVRLRGSTAVAETSIQGASGILSQSGTIEVQHDLRRNLSVTLSGTVLANDYQGVAIHEDGLSGSVRAEYRLTRWLALRASFTHDRLKSNVPFGSYTANTYLLGLRWQP